MMSREAWTDERLDDLNTKVDNGFARMEARFDKVDARFESMEERFDARFDSLQRTMIQGGIALSVGLLGMIAALIATQL